MNGSTPAANNPGTTERNSSTARALVPRSPARAVLEARPSTRSTSAYPLSFFARADAMDDVKNGQVDGILCWHNDRLHRHQRELEDFIELVDQSAIPVQTGHRRHLQFVGRERQDDRSYPCAVARQESEHKAERQRAKHDELAAQGSPSGGTRPFGLTEVKDGPDGRSYREEVPEEADAIREAARDIIAGTLVREICHTMRADIVIAAEPPVSLRAGILTVTTKPGSLIYWDSEGHPAGGHGANGERCLLAERGPSYTGRIVMVREVLIDIA